MAWMKGDTKESWNQRIPKPGSRSRPSLRIRTKLAELRDQFGLDFEVSKNLPWDPGYDQLTVTMEHNGQVYKNMIRCATTRRMTPEILEVMAETLANWVEQKKAGKII